MQPTFHTQSSSPEPSCANTSQNRQLAEVLALELASSLHEGRVTSESTRKTLAPLLEESFSCSNCHQILLLLDKSIASSVTFTTATEALAMQLYATMTAEDGTE